jgi:long-chain acyl-CoA synthetase
VSKWNKQLIHSLNGNQSTVRDLTSGKDITYQSLLGAAVCFGKSLGLPKQSIVSVVLPNSIEYLISYLACSLYGYIYAPLPYFLSAAEIEKALAYHESATVLTDRKDFKTKSLSIDPKTCILEIDSFQSIDLAELPLVDDSDVLCLYHSSGTTGNPKGVLYSHSNKYALIKSIVEDFSFTDKIKHFAFLPFGHTASLNYSIFPSLYLGSSLVFASNFESVRSKFFRILSENKIDYVEIVPTVAQTLIKLKENIADLNLENIRYIGCGSAPLSLSVQNEFEKQFGIRLANLYGLSETGPSHFDNPNSPGWEPGSIGVPLSVNECKISSDGEILLKGPNVMVGYYRNQELTSSVIKEGWFHTGDFGFESNGRYFFQDRKKDLIIVGGINVYPGEIEEVLYLEDRVIDCVVIGVPDRVQGEKILACISTQNLRQDDLHMLKIDLNHLCRKSLSPFKVPSDYFFCDEIPKTASGKLLRRKVKEQYLSELNNSEG